MSAGSPLQQARGWFAWRPPQIGVAEGLLLRIGVAAIIWFSFFPAEPGYTSQPHPNGLAHYFDFTFLANPKIWFALKGIAAASLVAYVAGFAVPISLGYVVWLMIAFGTLRNSQGNIHHGSQVLTTIMLAQWLAYTLVAIRQRSAWLSLFKNVAAHSKSYFFSQQALAAGYICAGIMKIDKGKPAWSLGLHWVEQIPNMAVTVTRNGIQHFYSEADGLSLMQHGVRVGTWIGEHPTLAKLVIGPGLYLELLVVLALCNRRLAFWIGCSMLTMHWMIAFIMQLRFPLNEWMILLFLVNAPFLLLAGLRKLGIGRQKLKSADLVTAG